MQQFKVNVFSSLILKAVPGMMVINETLTSCVW